MTKLDREASGTLATVELEGATDGETEELPTYCGPLSSRTHPVLAVRAAGQDTGLKSILLEVRSRAHPTKSVSAECSPGVVGALEPTKAEVTTGLECKRKRVASVRRDTTVLLAPARRWRTPLVRAAVEDTHPAAWHLRRRG